jgi:hypothetical protein
MPQVGHKWLTVTVVAVTSTYTVPDAVPVQQVIAYHVTACHAGQREDRIKHLEQQLKPCTEGISKLEAVNGSSSTIKNDNLYKQLNPKCSNSRSL